MPLLGSMLINLFTGLITYFCQWFTKKVAIGAAAVATFSALTLVLWAAIGAVMGTIVYAVPGDSAFMTGLWVALPGNASACFAATIAADTAVALYKWNQENLRLMAYIT